MEGVKDFEQQFARARLGDFYLFQSDLVDAGEEEGGGFHVSSLVR